MSARWKFNGLVGLSYLNSRAVARYVRGDRVLLIAEDTTGRRLRGYRCIEVSESEYDTLYDKWLGDILSAQDAQIVYRALKYLEDEDEDESV